MEDVEPKPVVAQPGPVGEVLIGEWDEAEHTGVAMKGQQVALVILTSAVLAVVSVVIGIWQHDANFYFATAVLFLIIVTMVTQSRRSPARLHIIITTDRVIVGKRQYFLNDLSGFWLSRDVESTVINIETKKPGIVPTSFFYEMLNEAQAREIIGQVLPELEPRVATAGDQINRYFRF